MNCSATAWLDRRRVGNTFIHELFAELSNQQTAHVRCNKNRRSRVWLSLQVSFRYDFIDGKKDHSSNSDGQRKSQTTDRFGKCNDGRIDRALRVLGWWRCFFCRCGRLWSGARRGKQVGSPVLANGL
ncbi:hypothetical protein HJC23_011108 [Cyclotella cryptica]|uniref:Uncharacterized protein n=1 Tax=Cyclotella cryptica TaxID=29204 RepID=A0ABD3P6V4_9STRA